MLGTGIAVAITGVVLLGIGGLMGVEWERREIEKYLRRRGNEPEPVTSILAVMTTTDRRHRPQTKI